MAQQAAYPNLSQQPPYQPTYNQTPSLNQPSVNPLQILANNMKRNWRSAITKFWYFSKKLHILTLNQIMLIHKIKKILKS